MESLYKTQSPCRWADQFADLNIANNGDSMARDFLSNAVSKLSSSLYICRIFYSTLNFACPCLLQTWAAAVVPQIIASANPQQHRRLRSYGLDLAFLRLPHIRSGNASSGHSFSRHAARSQEYSGLRIFSVLHPRRFWSTCMCDSPECLHRFLCMTSESSILSRGY